MESLRRDDILLYSKRLHLFLRGCMVVFTFSPCFKKANFIAGNDTTDAGCFSHALLLPPATCALVCSCSPRSSSGCSPLFPIPLPQATSPRQLSATTISPAWNSVIHDSTDASMQFFPTADTVRSRFLVTHIQRFDFSCIDLIASDTVTS